MNIFLNALILLSILYVYMYTYICVCLYLYIYMTTIGKQVTNLREQVSALMGEFEGRRGKGK